MSEADIEGQKLWVAARLATAPVATEPFAHLVVDGLVPDDVHDEIIARWPERARFEATNHPNRYELPLHRLMAAASPEEQAFWRRLSEIIGTAARDIRRKLTPHMGEKLAPLFGASWRETARRLTFSPGHLVLVEYDQELWLDPHVDNIKILVNSFLYVGGPATPDTQRGTILYRSRGVMLPTNLHIEPKELAPWMQAVRVVGFARNRLLSYVNSPSAFHGVARQKIEGEPRRLVIFGTLLSGAELDAALAPPPGGADAIPTV
jgi:hypothetical protein